MHRQPLIALLRAYGESHPDEATCANAFLAFVEEHEACFERTLLVGHVTGSAWVVNQAGTHVLMTHHRKLDRWLQLGGHADGDPDIQAVALREVREESGLSQVQAMAWTIFDLDIHTIPERKGIPEHLHYDVRFKIQATGDEPLVISEESKALAWVSLDEVPAKVDDASVVRMLEKWRKEVLKMSEE